MSDPQNLPKKKRAAQRRLWRTLRRLSWIGPLLATVFAALSAFGQWLQGVPLAAVIAVFVLTLFSAAFIYVHVVRTWGSLSPPRTAHRWNWSLLVLGAVNGIAIVLLVVLDPPDLGSTSFVFAGAWVVVGAVAVTAAKVTAEAAPESERLGVVVFRAGITTMGMSVVAIACGDIGLIIRGALDGSPQQAAFFAYQAAFLGALAVLVLQGRRRGAGFGFIAVGLALSGTGIGLLLHFSDKAYAVALLAVSATVILVGVAILLRWTYGFGGALVIAGTALIAVGITARAGGILPFFILYVITGSIVVLIGMLIVIAPGCVCWHPRRRTSAPVFAISLSTVGVVVPSSAIFAWQASLAHEPVLAVSFGGFAVAGAVLAAGAVYARWWPATQTQSALPAS